MHWHINRENTQYPNSRKEAERNNVQKKTKALNFFPKINMRYMDMMLVVPMYYCFRVEAVWGDVALLVEKLAFFHYQCLYMIFIIMYMSFAMMISF